MIIRYNLDVQNQQFSFEEKSSRVNKNISTSSHKQDIYMMITSTRLLSSLQDRNYALQGPLFKHALVWILDNLIGPEDTKQIIKHQGFQDGKGPKFGGLLGIPHSFPQVQRPKTLLICGEKQVKEYNSRITWPAYSPITRARWKRGTVSLGKA